jgi:hypothetical protein
MICKGKPTKLGVKRSVKPLHHLHNGGGRLFLMGKQEVRTKCRVWQLKEMKLFKVGAGGGGKKTETHLVSNSL